MKHKREEEMGKLRRFLGFLATVFVVLFSYNTAIAAYSCTVTKRYDACNAGYYLTDGSTEGTGSSINYTCTKLATDEMTNSHWVDRVIVTGVTRVTNKCEACPTGHTCAGYSASAGGTPCPQPIETTIFLNPNGGSYVDGITLYPSTQSLSVKYGTGVTAAHDGTAMAKTLYYMPARSYTVQYDGNGGTAGLTTSGALSSNFMGYYGNANGTGNAYMTATGSTNGAMELTMAGTTATKTTTEQTTWYAKWAPVSTVLPNAARDGYTFKGWYTAASGGTRVGGAGTEYTPTQNTTTLYAQWEPNTYSITYNLNGGSHGTSHPTTATYDSQFTVNNPTHAHGTFAGWKITGMDSVTHTYGSQTTTSTSISSTKATTFKNLHSTSGTVTFTALWSCTSGYTTGDNCSANTYTVSFDANGGSGTMGNQSRVYDDGEKLTANAFTRTGYTFNGWNTQKNGSGTSYGDGATGNLSTGATVTLYAQWTQCTACSGNTGANCSVSVSNNTCVYTTSCKGGYYNISNNGKYNATCSPVGDAYWSPDKDNSRYACTTATGWTTATGTTTASAYTSCYQTQTPSGCSSGTIKRTASSISGTTVSYGTETVSSTLFAPANSYVSETQCFTCSSFSSTYTKSDGGNISSGYCYKDGTTTGSQNPCSQPSNSVSYTCNSCTPGTCTYKDYYSANDTTCTPSNCNQSVKSATCKADFYGTTSCTRCPSDYPNSDQGTTSSSYCYTSCATGYSGRNYNGATDTCTANCNLITLNNTGNGGSGGTTALYKVSEDTGWFSDSDCATEITTLSSKPSKTNATYGGHYTATSDGTQIIDENGNLSTSWTTTSPTTLYAQYDCDANYRGSDTRIAGACSGTRYEIKFDYNNAATNLNQTIYTYYQIYGSGWTDNTGKSVTTLPPVSIDRYKLIGFFTEQNPSAMTSNGKPALGTLVVANDLKLPTDTTKFTKNTTLWAAWARDCEDPGTYGSCSLDINADGTVTYSAECDEGYTVSDAGTNKPQCTANTYYVEYDPNKPENALSDVEGSTAVTEHRYNEPKKLRANGYSLAGWTFNGWKDADGEFYYDEKSVSNLTKKHNETVILYAQWTLNEYTVTYNCGEGASGTAPAQATATYGNNFTPAENTCSRAGYTFDGWSVSGDTSGVKPAGVELVWKYTESKTFTAQWKLAGDSTITLNYNYDNITRTQTCNAASDDVSLGSPTRTGYTFGGWYNNSDLGGSSVADIPQGACTSDRTFWAKWIPKVYTFTLNTNGGTGGTTGSLYEKYGTGWGTSSSGPFTLTKIEIPTKTNNIFMGYCKESSGGECDIYATNSDGTLRSTNFTYSTSDGEDTEFKAIFKQCTCENGDYSSCSVAGVEDNKCSFAYSCDSGYQYNGTASGTWTADSGVYDYVAAPSCEPVTYTIQFDANGGSGTMGNQSRDYDDGERLTANAFTRTGYTFNGWNTQSNGSGTSYGDGATGNLSTTEGAKVTLYAQWTQCTACSGNTGANCSVSVSNNTCVYNTSCKGGYYNISNDRKYNASCSEVDKGYWSPDEDNNRYACTTATGWTTDTDTKTASSYTSCYQTQTPSGCSSGIIKRTASGLSGTTVSYGTPTVTSTLSAPAGSYVNDTACQTCPPDTVGGGTVNSRNDRTKITDCYTVRVNSSTPGKTGTGDQTCGFSTERNDYSASCTVKINTCNAGYYLPNSTDIECAIAPLGTYSTGTGTTLSYCKDLTGGDENTTTKETGSKTPTACYNKCDPITIDNGVQTAEPNEVSYDDTQKIIPACDYQTSCNTGYVPNGDKCEPGVFAVTLDHDGGTSYINTIYQKYNVGWFYDKDATSQITKLTLPTHESKTCQGYDTESRIQVVNAAGDFVTTTVFSDPNQDNKLVARYEAKPTVDCPQGQYYPGTGDACVYCKSGEYCPGVKGAYEDEGEKGREYCNTDAASYTVANGELAVTIGSIDGATSAADCFATNVLYKSDTGFATGTQTCKYNTATKTYTVDCYNQQVRSCVSGYWLAKADNTDCSEVGNGHWSAEGDININTCPGWTVANSSVITTGELETADSIAACRMGNIWDATKTTGMRKSCYHVSDAPASIDNYTSNCEELLVVACAGGYYYDKNIDPSKCIEVGNGHYSPGEADLTNIPDTYSPTTNNPDTASMKRTACSEDELVNTVDSDGNIITTASNAAYCEGMCPEDHYCENGVQYSCEEKTGGKFPYSEPGATSVEDCYTTCKLSCFAQSSTDKWTELCALMYGKAAICSATYKSIADGGVMYNNDSNKCVLIASTTEIPSTCISSIGCADSYYFDNDTVKCTSCSDGVGTVDGLTYDQSSGNTYITPIQTNGKTACYATTNLPCTAPVCPVESAGDCTYTPYNENIVGTYKQFGGILFYGHTETIPLDVANAFTCPNAAFECKPGYESNSAADIYQHDCSVEKPNCLKNASVLDKTCYACKSLPEALCTPRTYTFNLQGNYANAPTVEPVGYLYANGWYEPDVATSYTDELKNANSHPDYVLPTLSARISKFDVPTRPNHKFIGYFSTESIAARANVVQVTDANGNILYDNFDVAQVIDNLDDSDTTYDLYAIWEPLTTQCQSGMYYTGNIDENDEPIHAECEQDWYCPGEGSTNIGYGAGCRVACPDQGKTDGTGNHEITACYKTFEEGDTAGDGEVKNLENGEATWKCNWKGTADQGDYGDCQINIHKCDAGYYKEGGSCAQITTAHYSPEGDTDRYPCPESSYKLGADGERSAKKDCYVICGSDIPSVNHSTNVWVDSGSTRKHYNDNGSKYDACLYNVSCEDGYEAVSGDAPACNANKYIVTFNTNGGDGTIETSECTFDSGECYLHAMDGLTRAGYKAGNQWCVSDDNNGSGTCYAAGQNFDGNISPTGKDVTLYAKWEPEIFKIELSTEAPENATGLENDEQGPVYLKYGVGWFADADANQALTKLTELKDALPYIEGYKFSGYDINGTLIVDGSGNMQDTKTVVTNNATATVKWSEGDPITCLAGTYLPQGLNECATCPRNHYCKEITAAIDHTQDQGKIPCMNDGQTESDGATDATQCYKDGMGYNKNHAIGTQRCYFQTTGYDNCSWEGYENTVIITNCFAGYWYDANQTTIGCVEVGKGYYSPENNKDRKPCPDGGNTGNTTTATAVTECIKTVDYKSDTGNATGVHDCHASQKDDGSIVYDDKCNPETIKITWCNGGYYCTDDENATECAGNGIRDCDMVGVNHYSAVESLVRNECPYGGTTNTNVASTPEGVCAKTRKYPGIEYNGDPVYGSGTQGCLYTQSTDGKMYGDEKSDGYTLNCGNITITQCDDGYYVNTNASNTVCSPIEQGYYGPVTTQGSDSKIYKKQCPLDTQTGVRGTTVNDKTSDVTACFVTDVPCEKGTATGKTTCHYGTEAYDDCDVCVLEGCAPGSVLNTETNTCDACPENSYCAGGNQEPIACESDYPFADDNASAATQCYRECVTNDVENANAVDGKVYSNGEHTCVATMCQSGYYLVNGKCELCPAGSVCNPNENNGQPQTCDELTDGKYTMSDTGKASADSCFRNCDRSENATNMSGRDYYGDMVADTCAATACVEGYFVQNGLCAECESGKFCNPNIDNGNPQACPESHPESEAGATAQDKCFAFCPDVPNATQVAERDYFGGTDECLVTACEPGYFVKDNACAKCPAGSFCTPDIENGNPQACPTTHPKSMDGATSDSECFVECDQVTVENGIGTPVNPIEIYPTVCDYTYKTPQGNPCKVVDGVCVEQSCASNYEMIGGRCYPCNRENAISYKPIGNCVVESCATGYHPNGQECQDDVVECVAPNAVAAQQVWNPARNAFGECVITECEDGFHIGANACQPNEQVCEVENGVGIREWNDKTNTWGECIATKCDPGYTDDASLTNERWKQCGRCNNMYGANGELAASSYVEGCEIASCMYQGEKYILENNECRLICDTRSDDTGSRKWNEVRKKCESVCEPGYTQW